MVARSERRPSELKASSVPIVGKVHVLDVREGRLDDDMAVLDVAGRPGIFLDDVGRRKRRLVFEREFPPERQAADIAFEAADRHPGGVIAEDHVAHPRGDAAVDDGGDPGLAGGVVEASASSGKKEMSTMSLPAAMTSRRVAKPMEPGTAPTTRS